MLRLVGVVVLLGLGCDSLAAPSDEMRQAPHGPPPATGDQPNDGLAGGAGPVAPDLTLSLGGAFIEAPEPKQDPCVVAAQNGAIFCELGRTSLEYCVEAPHDGGPCVAYDRPPSWLHDLLIQCIAHCGVGIETSERELDSACCYVGHSQYYGR